MLTFALLFSSSYHYPISHMKLLLELTRVLNRNKTKNISVVSYNKTGASKIDMFYRALVDEKITSDEEAFTLLY